MRGISRLLVQNRDSTRPSNLRMVRVCIQVFTLKPKTTSTLLKLFMVSFLLSY